MTSKLPLHVVYSHLKRLSLPDQIEALCKLVVQEKPYSVRRNELESLLQGKRTRQIRKECNRVPELKPGRERGRASNPAS